MSEISTIKDPAPFIASTGVTIDPLTGAATVTGAVTLFSKKFVMERLATFSFNVSGTGSGAAPTAGTPATAWKIFAANDYDPTRPVQKPGTFVDVTADFGAPGASTPPGVKQFNGVAFSAGITDRMSSWACPYAAIQFQLVQASGTEVVTGQFAASEI